MIRFSTRAALTLLLVLLVWIAVDLTARGLSGLGWNSLFGQPRDQSHSAGLLSLVWNTLVVVAGALALAGPPALLAAALITQPALGGVAGRILVPVLEIGVGLPRIAWGLFGAVLFGRVLGLGFSVATGAMTLACLLAPVLATGFAAGLNAVPRGLRLQCSALGLGPWTSLTTQLLPTARPGVQAALALATGRGLGDAAALLFTAGVSSHFVRSAFEPGSTLAVQVHHLLTAVPGGRSAAYSAALVLFVLSFLVQAILQSGRGGHLSSR